MGKEAEEGVEREEIGFWEGAEDSERNVRRRVVVDEASGDEVVVVGAQEEDLGVDLEEVGG